MRMIVLVLALVAVAVVAYACARAGLARRRRQREREADARRAALAARERARAQEQARWDRQADDLSDAVTSVMPAINLPLLRQPRDDVPRAPAFRPRPPMAPDFDPPRPVRGRPAFDPPAFTPQPPMAPAFDPPPPARESQPSIFDPASRAFPPRPAEVSDFELPRQPEAESPWPQPAHPAIAHELTGSRAAYTADRGAPDRNQDRPSRHQGGRHGKHRSRS